MVPVFFCVFSFHFCFCLVKFVFFIVFSWLLMNVVGTGLLAVSGLFVVCLSYFLVITFMYIHKFLFVFFDWGLLFVFVFLFYPFRYTNFHCLAMYIFRRS